MPQAECPDTYRGKYTAVSHPGADLGKLYAGEVDSIIEDVHEADKHVCCFIAESMQSCGGQVIYPDGYFTNVIE